MKIPPILSNLALGAIFEASKLLLVRVKEFFHNERVKFVIGLSGERFSHAEFYINGKKDIRVAKDFSEMERLTKHFCQVHHLKSVSTFMLMQMWASRKLIRFNSQSVRLEIVTYWHF
jgi:hypothetical protein